MFSGLLERVKSAEPGVRAGGRDAKEPARGLETAIPAANRHPIDREPGHRVVLGGGSTYYICPGSFALRDEIFGKDTSMTITHLTHDAPTQAPALPPALANMNSKVLDEAILKKLVDPDVYYAFARCRATGVPMDREPADALALSIREWAQSKGCIGYSHWFSPIRGPVHGEKLETFVAVDFATDRLMMDLSGSELFQTETDGSSFPNGGLRETHEAAAYIGWDTGSPPFVYRQTLYIPSAFVSWTGEALDQKTPLLRADLAVNEQSLRLLTHLGDADTRQVLCNVGWEQEFFLIDREKYLARPDLVATGRTLVGAPPLRGQELSANYFARLPPRVNRYVAEARDSMWELGISIHCTHN